MSQETKDFIETIETSKEKDLISIGSSLKLCLVAEGEAGLQLQKYEDGAFSKHLYNKENLLNGWFVVQS